MLGASDDLPYLKAFGNSIMTELARMDASTSDRAKAKFISSISHELRYVLLITLLYAYIHSYGSDPPSMGFWLAPNSYKPEIQADSKATL